MAYQRSLVYVPDGKTGYYWQGQDGGIEGLNQDTWVIVYIAQIKTALEGIPYPYHILCKGDDLRIALAVPGEETTQVGMKRIKDDYVMRLSQTMKDVGHKIKIKKSFGSEMYFAFSKYASYQDIELPQSLRKIQKCHGATNAFLPSLDEYIAFSNAHSACRVAPIVLPSYYVALRWSYHYLLSHSEYMKLSDEQLQGILLVPSLLGGFPIIYLHNFHVPAESDLLSQFLHLLQYCREFFPPVADATERFCRVGHTEPSNYMMLLKDPYSLPLSKPPSATNVLRKAILPTLSRKARNESLLELLNFIQTDDQSLRITY